MQGFIYPAEIVELAPGDFELRFPDVPEAITGGLTIEAALAEASDALSAAMEGYLELGREPPLPSINADGPYFIPLDPVIAARVALVRAMTAQGLSRRALGARLGWDERAIRRVLSGRSVSADKVLDALRAVGLQPALAVVSRP
jgi:antitoxin HicB